MSVSTAIAPFTGVLALLDDLRDEAPGIEVRPPSAATVEFSFDAGTAPRTGAPVTDGPAVAFPTSVTEVRQLVRLAARHGVSIVPRGPARVSRAARPPVPSSSSSRPNG